MRAGEWVAQRARAAAVEAIRSSASHSGMSGMSGMRRVGVGLGRVLGSTRVDVGEGKGWMGRVGLGWGGGGDLMGRLWKFGRC